MLHNSRKRHSWPEALQNTRHIGNLGLSLATVLAKLQASFRNPALPNSLPFVVECHVDSHNMVYLLFEV